MNSLSLIDWRFQVIKLYNCIFDWGGEHFNSLTHCLFLTPPPSQSSWSQINHFIFLDILCSLFLCCLWEENIDWTSRLILFIFLFVAVVQLDLVSYSHSVSSLLFEAVVNFATFSWGPPHSTDTKECYSRMLAYGTVFNNCNSFPHCMLQQRMFPMHKV